MGDPSGNGTGSGPWAEPAGMSPAAKPIHSGHKSASPFAPAPSMAQWPLTKSLWRRELDFPSCPGLESVHQQTVDLGTRVKAEGPRSQAAQPTNPFQKRKRNAYTVLHLWGREDLTPTRTHFRDRVAFSSLQQLRGPKLITLLPVFFPLPNTSRPPAHPRPLGTFPDFTPALC